MAAYGQLEHLHTFHGYHWRVYEQDSEQTSQLRPSQPLHHTFPHLTLFTHTPYSQLPRRTVLTPRYELGRAARTRGAVPCERGVFLTPPPLLEYSSREARGKEGVGSTGRGMCFTQIRSSMGQYTPSMWSSGGKIDAAFDARYAPRARLGCGGAAPSGGAVVARNT